MVGEQCRLMKGEVASASFFDFFCLVLFSHVIFPEFHLPFSDAKVNHKEKDEMG